MHLLAFVVLYLGSVRITETEIMSLAGDAAADRLELVSREIDKVMLAPIADPARRHGLRALIASQRKINLQLFTSPTTLIGPPIEPPAEVGAEIGEFFSGEALQRQWLSSEGGHERMRSLRRITARQECSKCHEPGQSLAVASMSIDVTRMVESVRANSRRNLGMLLLAWAVLLGGINLLVKRSVEKFSKRLQAQLAAAEAGEPTDEDRPDLVLPAAPAQLGRALRDFLDLQRRRRAEVASRLEHSDQLASLGKLAAGLAHDIKNPLAGIQAAIEILREDSSEMRNVQLYDDMLGELGRVNNTLQLLLESSRPSPPKLVATDPLRLIKETVYLLRPGFKRRGVSVTYEIASGSMEAKMDEAKIRQVLMNLVQNAADSMENGGNIVIRAARFPDTETGLILAVEDDGPGIAEELQGKIFEPFDDQEDSEGGDALEHPVDGKVRSSDPVAGAPAVGGCGSETSSAEDLQDQQ